MVYNTGVPEILGGWRYYRHTHIIELSDLGDLGSSETFFESVAPWPECSITLVLGLLESLVEGRSHVSAEQSMHIVTCGSPVHPIYIYISYMRPRMNYIALSSIYIAARYLALLCITLRCTITLLDIIYLTALQYLG